MISWYSRAFALPRQVCRACGASTEPVPLLGVDHPVEGNPPLTLVRCPDCRSGQFCGAGIVQYTDMDRRDPTDDRGVSSRMIALRHYVEIGAGLKSMFAPLELLRDFGCGSLLDVGCGYGFTADYWSHLGTGRATGFEPSFYGEVGGRDLDSDIRSEYFDPDRTAESFDVVYASEVVEHVPDPAAFVTGLSRAMKDDGVLVLTTPDVEYLDPSRPLSKLIAVLSPGFHDCLFSTTGLRDLLARAGFVDVSVRKGSESQLVAYAMKRPGLGERLLGQPATQRDQDRLFGYLEHRCSVSKADYLLGGIAYRGFRETVNLGDIEVAAKFLAVLDQVLEKSWNTGIAQLRALPVDAEVRSPSAQYHESPYYLACLMYYLGMYRLLTQDVYAARDHLERALVLLKRAVASCRQRAQEEATLIAPCVYNIGICLLRQREPVAAARWYANELLGDGQAASAASEGVEQFRSRALLELSKERMFDGDWERCAELISALARRSALARLPESEGEVRSWISGLEGAGLARHEVAWSVYVAARLFERQRKTQPFGVVRRLVVDYCRSNGVALDLAAELANPASCVPG